MFIVLLTFEGFGENRILDDPFADHVTRNRCFRNTADVRCRTFDNLRQLEESKVKMTVEEIHHLPLSVNSSLH